MRVIYICMTSMHDKLTMKYWYPYMWCVSLQQCNKSPLIDTKFDERDACDDAIGWWMLWLPRVHCHIHDAEFLLQDFPSRWLRGRWKKRLRFQTRNEKSQKQKNLWSCFLVSTCKMCFLFSCLLSLSKVYGGAALRSFRRWVVWCLDSFFFAFWIWFCFLLPFRLCRFRFFQSWLIGRIGHFFRRKTRRMRPSGESHGFGVGCFAVVQFLFFSWVFDHVNTVEEQRCFWQYCT